MDHLSKIELIVVIGKKKSTILINVSQMIA